ncbi:MAG: hypothetical protein ACTSRH_19275 [Promethearchaeota archaeon]
MVESKMRSGTSFSINQIMGITIPFFPPNKYSKTECWHKGAS